MSFLAIVFFEFGWDSWEEADDCEAKADGVPQNMKFAPW